MAKNGNAGGNASEDYIDICLYRCKMPVKRETSELLDAFNRLAEKVFQCKNNVDYPDLNWDPNVMEAGGSLKLTIHAKQKRLTKQSGELGRYPMKIERQPYVL